MGFSLIIGIVISLVCIFGAFALEKGNMSSLVLLSPFLIVVGGTWGVIIASSSFKEILAGFKSVAGSFKKEAAGFPTQALQLISELSEKAKKNGAIALEAELNNPTLNKTEFLMLKEGIVLLTMSKSSDEIRYILSSDIRSYVTQKQLEIEIFEAAGGFSPTLGIIGTILGLINVLSNMGSPEQLAEAIAVAFIATFYGVAFANIIYLPIANRLKRALKRQKMQKQMILDGVCMIADGLSPRDVENHLALYYQAFDQHKKYKEGINN